MNDIYAYKLSAALLKSLHKDNFMTFEEYTRAIEKLKKIYDVVE